MIGNDDDNRVGVNNYHHSFMVNPAKAVISPFSTSSSSKITPITTTAAISGTASKNISSERMAQQQQHRDTIATPTTNILTLPHDHPYLDSTNLFLSNLSRGALASSREPSFFPSTSNINNIDNNNDKNHPPPTRLYSNRYHQPMVYHESYSFDRWPTAKQTFPMDKFRALAVHLSTVEDRYLPRRPLISRSIEEDLYRPLDCHLIPRIWFAESKSKLGNSSTSTSNLLSIPNDDDDDDAHADYVDGVGGGVGGPISSTYLDKFLSASLSKIEERRIGFGPSCKFEQLRERTVLEVAGTVLTVQLALKYGIATNLAGGTHHASYDCGSGYTILNDLAVAANFFLEDGINGSGSKHNDGDIEEKRRKKRVLVIDCDVHQGDGTARFGPVINSKHGDNSFVTLSLHCASNYPQQKALSTYDVGLPDGIGDEEYLRILRESVTRAFDDAEALDVVDIDIVNEGEEDKCNVKKGGFDLVLYDAGVDVHINDLLGRLELTDDGIRKRDRYVFEECVRRKIPVAGVIGGGYDKDLEVLAGRHAIMHEEAAFVWRKYMGWKGLT